MPLPLFILNFHGIGKPGHELSLNERELWIERTQFTAILDYVKNRNDIQLTFDDSNESDHSIALPALRERNLTAQFFVVAGRVGQPGYLSRSQIEALLAAGMAVGNHGMCHRRWVGLNPAQFQEELIEARDRIEQITGTSIQAAACPFGNYNRRVIHELRNAGYTRIYTSDGGPAWAGSLILPRNSIRYSCDVAAIEQMVANKPGGIRKVWRHLKLAWKRWR